MNLWRIVVIAALFWNAYSLASSIVNGHTGWALAELFAVIAGIATLCRFIREAQP